MNDKLLEQKTSGSGDDVKITIKRESLLANFPKFERMLSVGSLKEKELKNLQQVECSLKENTIMKWCLAEFWTACTYRTSMGKINHSKNTYCENRYSKKEVLSARIAVEKGE